MRHLASFLFSKNLRPLEVFILVVCRFGIYLSNLLSVEFQPDETFWIVSSVRFDKFLIGEFNDPIWSNKPLISFEVRPIPSYIVAISQRLGGIQADSLPEYWDWSLPRDENIARGAMPSTRVLWLSRLPMGLISVFSMLGMILLLAASHSRLASYLFALISINDYFLLHLRRAMSEAPLLLFTVFILYAAYKLLFAIQEKSLKNITLWSILVRIFSGMAGQSKLTGLACVVIPILGSLLLISRSQDIPTELKRRIVLVVTLVVAFTSLIIFFISYPFFYENTAHRILTTFYVRGQVVEQTIQSNERLAILFQRIFEYPLVFGTNTVIVVILHWINFFIAAFGFSYSLKQIMMKQRNQMIHIPLVLGTSVCAVPMLFTPLDWDRYYLYPIFFSCVFFAIGLGQLLLLSVSRISKSLGNQIGLPSIAELK